MNTEQKQYDAPTKQTPSEQQPEAKKPPVTESPAKGHRMLLSGREKTDVAKILGFAGALLVIGFVGLLFFLRPSESQAEKRKLTEFPTFTWADFWDGTYTSAITTWYADTFPGRDGLISVQQALENLYGIRTVRVVKPNTPSGGNTGGGATPGHEDGTPVEKLGTMYIKGNQAFESYRYNESAAARYAAILNRAAEAMPNAKVYDLIVPLSYSVNLTEREQAQFDMSDAGESVSKMYAMMNASVGKVSVLPELLAHKDEYLYFRTDHHWTARGAYYAYRAFCAEAGLTPRELDSWKRMEFAGFLGTLYSEAGRPSALGDTPDTVEAWIPSGTNKMTVYPVKGDATGQYPVIQTATDRYYAAAGSKYNCFIAGDNPLSVIENPDAERDEAIVVVKESFGNAFVPFLVDTYRTVYVVDYRTFRARMGVSLPAFVAEKGASTVLFLNNMTATSAAERLSEMEGILK